MGLTANVVPNTPIATAWGNEVRDRSVQVFATSAERASQWTTPPTGALSFLVDSLTLQIYNGTAWVCVIPGAAAVNPAGGIVDGRSTYGDLTGSVGPVVSIQTGARALVTLSCAAFPGTQFSRALMAVAVSGATTIAAIDDNAVTIEAPNAGGGDRNSAQVLLTTLTPGINTFTAQYKTLGGGGTLWTSRVLSVVGLP